LAVFEVSRVEGAESKTIALWIVASVETDCHKAKCGVECVELGFKLRTNFVVLVCPSNIVPLV
jgi:hypothetical protein